jgi:hypothetical protein
MGIYYFEEGGGVRGILCHGIKKKVSEINLFYGLNTIKNSFLYGNFI